MTDLIGHALKHAAADPDRAEELLGFFADAVENNKWPDPRLMEYIAKCFRRMTGDRPEPAALVLGLVRTENGQRRARTLQRVDERDVRLARLVVQCMDEHDMTRNDAIGLIAEKHNSGGTSTVKAAYDTFGASIRRQQEGD